MVKYNRSKLICYLGIAVSITGIIGCLGNVASNNVDGLWFCIIMIAIGICMILHGFTKMVKYKQDNAIPLDDWEEFWHR